MLAKKFRLGTERDINLVIKKGHSVYSQFFNFKYLKSTCPHPRFCIIISTKISKKAVIRNHSKRQISSALEKLVQRLKYPIDAVILTYPSVVTADFSVIEQNLATLMLAEKLI